MSPGDIKETPCFIHRHKAAEFAQIKFSRLCLRAPARGLTPTEMIGFLRLMKEEKKKSHAERCGAQEHLHGVLKEFWSLLCFVSGETKPQDVQAAPR